MKRSLLLLLAMCMAYISGAQLCTGSLGDPVVHITFGSGSNPGAALPGATTNYTYFANDCPQDGLYTVRNSTSNCFGSTWHSITQDHTPGDVDGYFMVVNASFQPGDFYVATVSGLCANTTYEFAAWVANLLKPSACSGAGIDPDITFKIETTSGATLASYNTGNIPESGSPNWKQYGLFFQTPASTTSVVVRITNNAPGGCGNDLALDDITFRPCGPSVSATLAITGGTSTGVCASDRSDFMLTGNYPGGYANPAFQWQVSANGGPFTDIAGANTTNYLRPATGAGQYRYRLTVAESENMSTFNCRVASNLITIDVNPLPIITLTDTVEGCAGSNISFSASGGSTYQWTGPNGFSSSLAEPVIVDADATDQGLYRVMVTTDKGCSLSDSGYLRVNPPANAQVAGNDHICQGSGTVLQASGGVSYSWSPAVGLSSTTVADPTASPADTTTYKVVVRNQYGCADSAEIQVKVWKLPKANAGPDKITREGLPVTLTGAISGTDVSYFWTPAEGLDDDNSLRPTALLTEDKTYTLNVVSNKGCGMHSDNVLIKVYKKVVVPNAFSPNGDGINDVWQIPALQTYPGPEITVFNRYGQAVYRSKGYGIAWDGKFRGTRLPVGTYYYVIDLKITEEPVMSGWVFIVY